MTITGNPLVFTVTEFIPERRKRKTIGYEFIAPGHFRIFDYRDDRIGTARSDEEAKALVRELAK